MAGFSGKLMHWIVGLAGAGMVFIFYIDFVYLPQKRHLDEQHSAIGALQEALRDLRQEDSALRKRLLLLEGAGRGGAPPGPGGAVAAAAGLLALAEGSGRRGGPAIAGEAQAPRPPALPSAGALPWANARAAAVSAPLSPTQPTRAKQARWRGDLMCGAGAEGPDGQLAECNPSGDFPCCAPSGWCGGTEAHCGCQGCVDYRSRSQSPHVGPPASSPRTETYDESKPRSIALVVPFRNREVHLERFRERIQSHVEAWNAKGVRHNWMVFIVEQFDNELFNRGYLFNVGLRYATEHAEKTGVPFDCVVMHDIDIIPESVVDYGWCLWPNQLAGEIECWSWSVPYQDYAGGVVSLSPTHWSAINGFSNEYEGWGGEDDDLYLRLKQTSLLKGGCHIWCKKGERPTAPMVHRPPLGRGRFNCLHDGDHTPRQRAPNDAPMWSRLNAMKQGSKRWKEDGISSLKVHAACAPLEAPACDRCATAEDPVPQRRLFAEHWSRVSSRPLGSLERLSVRLLPDHRCAQAPAPLRALPAGLEPLRALLPTLFPPECIKQEWAQRANFVLVDLTLGQALLAGEGAATVVPDSALPPIREAGGGGANRDPEAQPTSASHLVQSQRLIRWLRRLPQDHQAWIVATDAPLDELRRQFVGDGRRVPQTVPVCASQASLEGSNKKYRVTPGTVWCGEAGWAHLELFEALRSMASVPAERLVPICISYNKELYTYRFEPSEDGCVGYHKASGTSWTHAHTIHSSKDARGERVCVGVANSGATTRWMMRKQETCNSGGFQHTFNFSSMAADQYSAPLLPACLLADTVARHDVRRLAAGHECRAAASGGAPLAAASELVLLAARQAETDYRICTAEGQLDDSKDKKGKRLWRAFWNATCEKQKLVTTDAMGRETHWTIAREPAFFVPSDASGARFCLCSFGTQRSSQGGGASAQDAEGFFSWFHGDCPASDAQRELCLQDLSVADVLRYSNLIDEVV